MQPRFELLVLVPRGPLPPIVLEDPARTTRPATDRYDDRPRDRLALLADGLTGPGFHYSPVGVGLFALVGAAGAAVAPFAGHWADHGLTRPMTGIALAVAAASFTLAGLGGHSAILLALAAVLIDMAVQATLILGQHTVYQLDPAARARLNSAFIAMFFIGGAAGSQLGSVAYHSWGWTGVTALGTALPLIALLYWTTERRQAATVTAEA
ncbi:MFS transporter [Kitasatospora sp. NPDC101235]|uniref:MFS transporter n=1 Tax=Kitasatospora sp. NPDC101235 TaxID=3364101 RepID=UPI00381D26A5